MAQKFQYPPLNQSPGTIRLLILGAGVFSADCFDLKIWVNDCHFSVRQNLHCALKALRSTGDRYLWIDTLCINQDDSHEKGHQVGMMDLIYEKAKQVLVWLGYPDNFHARAMSTDARFAEDSLPAFELVKSVVEGSKKNPLGFDEWGHLRPYFRRKWTPHWKQLADLFAAAYWRRLWIVQEVGLASKLQILYGTSICDGIVLLHFRELLYRLPVWPAREDKQALFHATATIPDIGISIKQILDSQAMFIPARVREIIYGNGFESLLSKCEEQLCAERRDKVYAILRLPHDVKDGDIPVDYTISIPELYERTLSWSNKREGNTYVDRFSGVVLRALLGPLSLENSSVDMFDAESSLIENKFCPQSSLAEYEIRTLLIGRLWILPLSIPWIDATLEHIQNPELLLNDIPEDLDLMGRSTLTYSLERLWEVDPKSILTLEGSQRTETVKLFTFKTGSETRLGLGPSCLQDSDILCRLTGDSTVAICRYENDDYHFVARAVVSSGQRGKKKADVTKHHPLWPPPDLDVYNGPVDNPTLVRKWKVGLGLLQALTCPLKWRNP